MGVSNAGWKNKSGTSDRDCTCGTWKDHWIAFSGKEWPEKCSVFGCDNKATLGAHVFHADVTGERIVPMCSSCNRINVEFNLKGGTGIPSASPIKTCNKPGKA